MATPATASDSRLTAAVVASANGTSTLPKQTRVERPTPDQGAECLLVALLAVETDPIPVSIRRIGSDPFMSQCNTKSPAKLPVTVRALVVFNSRWIASMQGSLFVGGAALLLVLASAVTLTLRAEYNNEVGEILGSSERTAQKLATRTGEVFDRVNQTTLLIKLLGGTPAIALASGAETGWCARQRRDSSRAGH